MASLRDFEKLWEQYQKEGIKRDISIELYCKSKGVVYSHFERWYRSYFRKSACEVEIINSPQFKAVKEPKSSVADEKLIAKLSTTDFWVYTNGSVKMSYIPYQTIFFYEKYSNYD